MHYQAIKPFFCTENLKEPENERLLLTEIIESVVFQLRQVRHDALVSVQDQQAVVQTSLLHGGIRDADVEHSMERRSDRSVFQLSSRPAVELSTFAKSS